jgi:hypothetical protein
LFIFSQTAIFGEHVIGRSMPGGQLGAIDVQFDALKHELYEGTEEEKKIVGMQSEVPACSTSSAPGSHGLSSSHAVV